MCGPHPFLYSGHNMLILLTAIDECSEPLGSDQAHQCVNAQCVDLTPLYR